MLQPRRLYLIGLICVGLALAGCQASASLSSPTLATPRPIQTAASLVRATTAPPTLVPAQPRPTQPLPTVPPPTAPPPTPAPTMSPTQPPPTVSSLEGSFWRLVAYADATGATMPALPTVEATLEFRDGKAHANSGCNDAAGDYRQTGAQLSFGGMAQTAKLCKEAMDQEKGYFAALKRVTQFGRTGDELRLLSADGATVALLRVFPPAPLMGTAWRVLDFRDRDGMVMLFELHLTAQFSADGKVSGFAGCNQFTGPYSLQGGKIQIGPLATTRKACASPQDVMRYEQVFLADLARSTTLRSLGNTLDLLADDGTVQVNLRVAPP